MREICKSGSEGGAGQTNVPFLPLSTLEGQQQNPKGKPNRACERDQRSSSNFNKQVFVR